MNGVAIIIELSNPAFLLSFQFLLIHSLKGQFGNCYQLKDQNPSIRLLSVLPLPTQHFIFSNQVLDKNTDLISDYIFTPMLHDLVKNLLF